MGQEPNSDVMVKSNLEHSSMMLCKGTNWCDRVKGFSTSWRFSCPDGKVDSEAEISILSPAKHLIISDGVNQLLDIIQHVCLQPIFVCP